MKTRVTNTMDPEVHRLAKQAARKKHTTVSGRIDSDILLDVALALEPHLADSAEATRALALPMADVEDAFQAAAALTWNADFTITRNLPADRQSPVPAISPADFLKKL